MERAVPFENPPEPTSALARVWRSGKRRLHRSIAPVGGFHWEHAFHLQFWRFAAAQGLPGVVPLSFAAWHSPPQLKAAALGLITVKICIGGLLSAAIVSKYFPIHISEWGLRARNLFGMAREVAWEDIESVDHIRWLIFTRYVRLSTAGKRHIIWLPLFLKDMPGFAASVRELAPEGNPLRSYLDAC
jgi:hypothetical protein